MNFDDQLIPCTLNGQVLPLRSFTNEHAKALGVHSYLDAPGGDVSDNGANPLEVTLEAVISGPAAHQNLRALVGMIEATPAPLVLTHPGYGPMPVGVRRCRARYEAGKRRYEVTLEIVRDTPTVSVAIAAPVVYDIPETPVIEGANADFFSLASVAMQWLSFLNEERSALLSALNAIAMLGPGLSVLTDVATEEIGSWTSLMFKSIMSIFGAYEAVSDFPDDVIQTLDGLTAQFEFQLAWVFGEPLSSLRDIGDGKRAVEPGRFVSGRLDDGGPDEAEYALFTAWAGMEVAAAIAMTQTAIARIKEAESRDALTAAAAERAVDMVYRRLLIAHRCARQILPGGRAAAALGKAAADLQRFFRGLKIRRQMRQVIALTDTPLFLLLADYGIDPSRIAEVIRANDLDDVLAVPAGARVWLPAEAA